jgi:hypothetical protein
VLLGIVSCSYFSKEFVSSFQIEHLLLCNIVPVFVFTFHVCVYTSKWYYRIWQQSGLLLYKVNIFIFHWNFFLQLHVLVFKNNNKKVSLKQLMLDIEAAKWILTSMVRGKCMTISFTFLTGSKTSMLWFLCH